MKFRGCANFKISFKKSRVPHLPPLSIQSKSLLRWPITVFACALAKGRTIRKVMGGRMGNYCSPCPLEFLCDENGVTGLQNSHPGVIAALKVLFELVYLPLLYGTIGGPLNISLSNNPVCLGGHFTRVELLEVIGLLASV